MRPKKPSLPPMPADPAIAEEAARKRNEAERTAIAASKAGGRRSTMVGGALLAQEEQMGRGQRGQAKRRAAADLYGWS